MLSENYLNSTRGKNSARLYSIEHREKLLEKWRLSPPERRAKWHEIVTERNAKTRAAARARTHKSCTACKILKALDEYPKNRTAVDGHNTMCFECRRQYDLNRYAAKGAEIKDRIKQYRKSNRAKVNATDAAKIKNRKNATPKWLDADQWTKIEEFYELALARTLDTGTKHHVDHIVPIKGKRVSGLNVPWNLQVLTAKENMRKHARFEE